MTTADGKAVCFASTTPTTLKYEGGEDVTGVVQVSGRGFTEEARVVLGTGAVHCGRHTMISRTPVVASGATMVFGGLNHACGQDWNGQLGGLGASSDPGVTLVPSGAVAVVGGQFHTCVLLSSGQMQCSGQNQTEGAGLDKGQLTPVAGISNATAISAGKHYSCARLADATVRCWGSISHSATPAAISGVTTRSCD
ncbi:hypothetical protein BE20_02210 [Sorangium cellulosum]|uniref:Uncharacterized protein n=1 Tax=Sorangium cellulosum TaxID=56 RepID=A0A150SDC1_SORCE|nr:hypothetical protein BE18_29320 [Sorangium cellulosum]KYF90409.1 hypothetical protein BE20_02210 [Sorangium cellulosum]